MPYPQWLHVLAWVSLSVAFLCALIIAGDIMAGHRQKMAIMNLVWPITALYFGPLALWAYFRFGRNPQGAENNTAQTSLSVFHCGAGCTLGDIAGEFLVFALAIEVAGQTLYADFLIDLAFAYVFGIVFQYFSIVPMRGLSFQEGVKAALRADTLSIIAFQIGMFGWMAIAYFLLFPNPHLHPNEGVHWFMMQIAMMLGFVTSYPANVFLLKKGWKEKMGGGERHASQEREAA